MNNETIVRKYYRLVDTKKFEPMLELFSSNTVYNRCGYVIKGMKNLRKFYETERKLKGKHVIDNLTSKGSLVISTGTFKGINKRKQKINIDFADLFEIKRGIIVRRHTYISNNPKLIQ
jgi:ketosteroid isomerase-like protein